MLLSSLMSSRDVQERFLKQAIELAREARAEGNHPFGSLLTIDDTVILTAKNTVFTDRDPTAHAETNLVADAIRRLSPDEIRRSVLYTSCEPCAIAQANSIGQAFDRSCSRCLQNSLEQWRGATS